MYQRLCKGMAIYRQNHTKSYYLRLRIDKKEIRRTLSTSDLDLATQRAWQIKFEYEGMLKAGLEINPIKSFSIEKASLSIIKHLQNKKPFKPIYKDYILIYTNFIIPFFKGKSIEELTTKNIRLYFESLQLSKTRKTINKTCFTRLFEYLEEEGELKKRDFPSFPKDIKTIKNNIGIDFKENELKIIRDFINSDPWLNQKNINFKTFEYRSIFSNVFEFLLNTGIRTGEEMNNIHFSDIHKEKNNFYIKIRKGKNKEHNQREVLLNEKSINALINIVFITKNKAINKNQLLSLNGLVFQSSFNKIADFCKIFDQIIKRLIASNSIKNKYTLYSCRHTYITNMLINGVDMYLISKQVGNSLEMIQRHYDHSMLKDSKHTKALLSNDRTLKVVF